MSILKKPLNTEKFTRLGEKLNQFGFIVDKHATKAEIKAEVEKVYEVKVTSVNTMMYAGKTTVKYTKRNFIHGKKPSFKKAVVTLKEGNTIDFYNNL
ncbi:MAG: 50S ribosomal protein L23 [Bacteroidetes bacterium]|nr:50S ribosomal protein L23 [Bacteroidota bacterium]